MKVEFLNLESFSLQPYRKTPVSQWDGVNWLMKGDLILRITDAKKVCHLLTIPTGFKTDFASVPRIFWRILQPTSAAEASIPHDFLYRKGIVTKAQADKIFLLGMVALKIPRWKRQTMFYAVKVFGGSSYNKFTEEKLPIKL